MSIEARVGYIEGNHIGPVLIHDVALPVAAKAAEIADIEVDFQRVLAGTDAYEETEEHLPKESIEQVGRLDALIKAPIGGPPDSDEKKYKGVEVSTILPLRERFAFVNLRPLEILGAAGVKISPLPEERIEGTDAMVVRELIGDVYFGESGSGISNNGERYAYETSFYTESQVERTVRAAIRVAQARGENQLMWVHKTNVLPETGALWRDVVHSLAEEAGINETPYMHADAFGAALVRRPNTIHTAVTPNFIGDMVTDVAAEVAGSIGLSPSASLGEGNFGLYEPIGGAAWDIEDPADCNPIGMIRSIAMMYRYTFDRADIAKLIGRASEKVLNGYYMTPDLIETSKKRLGGNVAKKVSAAEFTAHVLDRMGELKED